MGQSGPWKEPKSYDEDVFCSGGEGGKGETKMQETLAGDGTQGLMREMLGTIPSI